MLKTNNLEKFENFITTFHKNLLKIKRKLDEEALLVARDLPGAAKYISVCNKFLTVKLKKGNIIEAGPYVYFLFVIAWQYTF